MAEESGFLDWGGNRQSVYERWRQRSLAGDEVECFLRWGMSLLAPERWEQGGFVVEVRRRRASVRSGEFSLGEFLFELGILGGNAPRRPQLEPIEICR